MHAVVASKDRTKLGKALYAVAAAAVMMRTQGSRHGSHDSRRELCAPPDASPEVRLLNATSPCHITGREDAAPCPIKQRTSDRSAPLGFGVFGWRSGTEAESVGFGSSGPTSCTLRSLRDARFQYLCTVSHPAFSGSADATLTDRRDRDERR